MKYRYLKEVPEPVPAYGGNHVMKGDVIELDGWLAQKAERNPDYERVSDMTQSDGSEVFMKKKTKKKKKVGRPRKNGNQG